jgi:hypothetical protein
LHLSRIVQASHLDPYRIKDNPYLLGIDLIEINQVHAAGIHYFLGTYQT